MHRKDNKRRGEGRKKERIIYFRKEKMFCFFDSYLI